MASYAGTPRLECSRFSSTWATDRASLSSISRTRRRLAPLSLEGRKKKSVLHPEERGQFRKLLTDPDNLVSMITRPRNGCCWGAMGAALRQCDDRPTDRSCPYLLNESWDCFELSNAFPEFCALGARPLLPRMKNRLVFEVRSDPSARKHIAQVGLARVQGEADRIRSGCLDESTPLLESFVYTSAGDFLSSAEPLEVIAPGTVPGLRFRLEHWCTGGPTWLADGALVTRVMMEVDLRRGRIAISLGEWAADPLVFGFPSLIEGDVEGKRWLPFISLTADGQSARLVDFHASVEA